MDRESLADLIHRAQLQDAAAFDALVDHFAGRVYGFILRMTAARDDAQDLTQEVFLRVVRMIGKYQDDGRFEAWIFRIAANLVRDRGRRSQRQPARLTLAERDGEGEGLDQFAGDEDAPHAPLERGEDVERLTAALQLLPEAEREVIMLRYFADMSFKEIAESMGTPLGTALARSHRGLARLRELMGEAKASAPNGAEQES